MFGNKKYIVDTADKTPGQRTPTERVTGGPVMVHGRKDLKARQDAAKKAGVKLTVRKAPKPK